MKRLGKPASIWYLSIFLALCCALCGWNFVLRVLPAGAVRQGKEIRANLDLIPVWEGSREVLFAHGDPYSPQVTRRIQLADYGREVTAAANFDQQRFAYPAFSAFLFWPLAALPLAAAERLASFLFALLSAASVCWWAGRITIRLWVLATLLLAASFPFIYGLYGLQPSLLVAGILSAAFAAARSNRLALCGALLALSVSKPQLAIFLVLPLAAWVLADLRRRKRLLLSFACCAFALALASGYFVPGWFVRWLGVLRAYGQYTGAKPLLFNLMGNYIGAGLSAAILIAAIAMIWICRQDLAFSTACCVAAFSLLIPFEQYNGVMLLAPILWMASHRETFAEGPANLFYAAVAVALCEHWLSAVAISLLHLLNPGLACALWWVPLSLSGMVTLATFLAIFYYGFSACISWRAGTPTANPA